MAACLNILYLPEKFPLKFLTSAYFHIRSFFSVKPWSCQQMTTITLECSIHHMSQGLFLYFLTCDFLFIFAQICYILISMPSLRVFHYIENNYSFCVYLVHRTSESMKIYTDTIPLVVHFLSKTTWQTLIFYSYF